MKKITVLLLSLLLCLSLAAGCTVQKQTDKQAAIPFADEQYYAVAHLGYRQIDDLGYYAEKYLGGNQPPVHYFSDGDYYLVIPRYSGMEVSLYKNNMETPESVLIYEDADCKPFIMQCNISDIFADVTVQLTYQDKTVKFSPFISLKDGSLDIGEQGLDITKAEEE